MRLRAWDLAIERGGRRLFAGLSFEADEGSALIVTGPNGAGKSSLLRALCGFLPVAGRRFRPRGRRSRADRRRAGPLSRPRRRAEGRADRRRESRLLGGRARRRFRRARRAARRFARVGLAHVIDFPARALSAGQKRRVALARLLVARRPLWLLDEPTTALDAAAQAAFAAIMQSYLDERRHHGRRDPRPARACGRAGAAGSGRAIGAIAA